jgi:hypothetical protein
VDDQLVDALRRRAERGAAPDVWDAFGDAHASAARRRRRRRTTVIAALACVVVVVGVIFAAVALSGSGDHVEVASKPHDSGDRAGDAFQLRPVLGEVPVADAAAAPCGGALFGSDVPTTPADSVDPAACVVLAQDGVRYLLRPAQVDGADVASATKDDRGAEGWVVELTLTPSGAKAFDDLARQQFHRQMAVVADGVLVATPTIQPDSAEFGSFHGHVVVSGADEAGADAVLHALGR